MFDQAALLPEDKSYLTCEFLNPLEDDDMPVDWALNKVDFLSQKGDLFSPTETMAENVGYAMGSLTRYICQRPQLSDPIRIKALNLLEQLAKQPLLPKGKRTIQAILLIAKEKTYIQPFRERLDNVEKKITLLY